MGTQIFEIFRKRFFYEILLSIGAKCYTIGNYIIAHKLFDRKLNSGSKIYSLDGE